MSASATIEAVREYYGSALKSSADLKTTACCAAEAPPPHLASILERIHPEVTERFYGCGCPLPPALAEAFGHPASNVDFVEGYIEDLAAAGVADESVDVVVSNCVLNLSPDKPRVFAEIWRALRPGGELYFADVFARAFKLALEDRCEDYGQVAWYLGTLPEHPHAFELDGHHRFETGRPLLVCGNTAEMLTATRYAPHFRVDGDRSVHHGLFDCSPGTLAAAGRDGATTGCC